MRHWLGLVVVALSAGLFADAAHGSPVFEWNYSGPRSSHFGYSDDHHEGDYYEHEHHRDGSSHERSWNHEIDTVHDWGHESYQAWNFTWSDGRNPGPDYKNSCYPHDDHPEHPQSYVPVPAAAVLFGSGLAFIFGVGQRKKRHPNTLEEV